MVICWKPNQASTIHNHAVSLPHFVTVQGQRCWAAVLEGNILYKPTFMKKGTIQETHFHFANTHQPNGEGPLEVADVQVHKRGEVLFFELLCLNLVDFIYY